MKTRSLEFGNLVFCLMESVLLGKSVKDWPLKILSYNTVLAMSNSKAEHQIAVFRIFLVSFYQSVYFILKILKKSCSDSENRMVKIKTV